MERSASACMDGWTDRQTDMRTISLVETTDIRAIRMNKCGT